MKWSILITILIFVNVLESTALQFLTPASWGSVIITAPRFGLVVLIFISLFISRRKAFILGLLYGLIQDVLFSDVIGVYAFTMAFVPYFCALLYRYFQLNILLIMITVFLGVYAHESVTSLLFQLFGLSSEPFQWMDPIPTALVNSVFAVLVYQPLSSFLEKMKNRQEESRG